MTPGSDAAPARIAILADDLIWATRLAGMVRAAGWAPVSARTAEAFTAELAGVGACIVDLTALAYDGTAALAAATAAGVPAVAVAQHDDADLRRAARAAGAAHVYAYRALFEHGDRDLGGWLATLRSDPATLRSDPATLGPDEEERA